MNDPAYPCLHCHRYTCRCDEVGHTPTAENPPST